ncbi:hypothetical protein GGI42DRAFT_116441 [Trichoderma sp. SZMC 28013]
MLISSHPFFPFLPLPLSLLLLIKWVARERNGGSVVRPSPAPAQATHGTQLSSSTSKKGGGNLGRTERLNINKEGGDVKRFCVMRGKRLVAGMPSALRAMIKARFVTEMMAYSTCCFGIRTDSRQAVISKRCFHRRTLKWRAHENNRSEPAIIRTLVKQGPCRLANFLFLDVFFSL